MSIREFLRFFDFQKRWTYILMILMFIFFYLSQWNYLTTHTLPQGAQTSLTSAELLVGAGLTITFYTLLEQVIRKAFGDYPEYADIKRITSFLILTNVFFVALAIIEILISSMGLDSLRISGFTFLVNSWVYNVIIMFFVLAAPVVERALKTEGQRVFINILYIAFIIFSLARIFIKPV